MKTMTPFRFTFVSRQCSSLIIFAALLFSGNTHTAQGNQRCPAPPGYRDRLWWRDGPIWFTCPNAHPFCTCYHTAIVDGEEVLCKYERLVDGQPDKDADRQLYQQKAVGSELIPSDFRSNLRFSGAPVMEAGGIRAKYVIECWHLGKAENPVITAYAVKEDNAEQQIGGAFALPNKSMNTPSIGNEWTIFLPASTLTGIPGRSRRIHLRIDSGKTISERNLQDNEAWVDLPVAEMTEPPAYATLTASEVTFKWTPRNGVDDYVIYVGTTAGGSDINVLYPGKNTEQRVTLPALYQQTIFVRLWSRFWGAWCYRDYTYTCNSKPDFYFSDKQSAQERGIHISYFLVNSKIPSSQSPMDAYYYEDKHYNPPKLTLISSDKLVGMDGLGEHEVVFGKPNLSLAPAGSTGVKYVLDATKVVDESNEDNNEKSYDINFNDYWPDLRFSTLEDSGPNGLTISYIVDRIAIGAAKNPKLVIYFSDNAFPPNLVEAQVVPITEKAVGEHRVLIPNDVLEKAGTATKLLAALDTESTVVESDEFNNRKNYSIPGVGADYSWSGASTASSYMTLHYKLKGSVRDWDNPILSVYLEDSSATPGTEQLIKTEELAKDAATGEHEVTISKALLNSTPYATGLRCVLDSNDDVNEEDETNNEQVFDLPPRRFDLDWVGMQDSHTLLVKYSFDFSGMQQGATIKVASQINGKAITQSFMKANTVFPQAFAGQDWVALDLAALQVPKFTDNTVFKVSVYANGVLVATRGVAIPLPVIFVGGIDPVSAILHKPQVSGGNGAFAAFENSLNARLEQTYGDLQKYPYELEAAPWTGSRSYCYLVTAAGNHYGYPVAPGSGSVDIPYYPTMHTLSYFGEPYDCNSVGLFLGGDRLREAVDTILRRTYARRVNIIAHSKGCLVTRAMLESSPAYGTKVYHAVMIQGPHAGAVVAQDPWAAGLLPQVSDYRSDVYHNLWPVYNFYQNSTDSENGKWHARRGFSNTELTILNKKSLPSDTGTKYTLMYTDGKPTPYLQRGGQRVPPFYTTQGDYIVPIWSQRGYTIDPFPGKSYKSTKSRGITRLLPAFAKAKQKGRVEWVSLTAAHCTLPTRVPMPVGSMDSTDTFAKVWRTLWETSVAN